MGAADRGASPRDPHQDARCRVLVHVRDAPVAGFAVPRRPHRLTWQTWGMRIIALLLGIFGWRLELWRSGWVMRIRRWSALALMFGSVGMAVGFTVATRRV